MKIYICGYRPCRNNGLVVTVLRPPYKSESVAYSYVFDQLWSEDLDIVRNAFSEGSPLLGTINYRNGFGFLRVLAPVIGPEEELTLPSDAVPPVFRN